MIHADFGPRGEHCYIWATDEVNPLFTLQEILAAYFHVVKDRGFPVEALEVE